MEIAFNISELVSPESKIAEGILLVSCVLRDLCDDPKDLESTPVSHTQTIVLPLEARIFGTKPSGLDVPLTV
jgi:hypothetical protein